MPHVLAVVCTLQDFKHVAEPVLVHQPPMQQHRSLHLAMAPSSEGG